MTTEIPATFGDRDEALFDAEHAACPTSEGRSVGEMLFDVDHRSRQMLIDVSGDDAGALLRGWPPVVEAARQLWGAFPGPSPFGDHIERVAAQAARIEASVTRARTWPGPGEADPRMIELADTLHTATVLVRRYGTEIATLRVDVQRDLAAARSRVMHSLYVSAHAVNVALHEHGRDLVDAARARGRVVALSPVHSPYAVAPTTQWIGRIVASESICADYLAGRFAKAVDGEVAHPVGDPSRIPQALAQWEIQAHRALATDPAPANIVLVARTQGLLASAGLVLIEAAVRADLLDATPRLASAVTAAGRSWSNIASRWTDLAPAGSHVNPPLIHAAAEVRAALRELTHDNANLASTEIIATRPGLGRATDAMRHCLETSVELAQVVAEKANSPRLFGAARALSIRAHNDIETGMATPPLADQDVVWVSPADILAKRLIPVPPPVTEALQSASRELVTAAESAASISSVHPGPSRDSVPVLTPEDHAHRDRSRSDRQPADLGRRPGGAPAR